MLVASGAQFSAQVQPQHYLGCQGSSPSARPRAPSEILNAIPLHFLALALTQRLGTAAMNTDIPPCSTASIIRCPETPQTSPCITPPPSHCPGISCIVSRPRVADDLPVCHRLRSTCWLVVRVRHIKRCSSTSLRRCVCLLSCLSVVRTTVTDGFTLTSAGFRV